MAKTPVSTLITDLAKRLDLNPGAVGDGSAERVDLLRQLNVSQMSILQDYSLRFLETDGTLALANSASTVAVPTTIDDGKTMTLGKSTGDGELTYVEPDAWYKTFAPTTSPPTTPLFYTISLVSGTLTFSFKPTNTSGSSINIPYKAQLIPVAMATDATNVYSVLPEGWEDTLLLDHAEVEQRRFIGEALPEYLLKRIEMKSELLYASYRSTKEVPWTDREQKDRKAARELLAPERIKKSKERGQDV